jgi:hypothetical protein
VAILTNEGLWRISLTSTLSKGYFKDIGILRPTEWMYQDYSEVLPQSQGGQAKQGYINIILIWARLNRFGLYLLETYRAGAGTGLLYLTIDRANGEGSGVDWIDISCYPGVIQYANQPGVKGDVKTGTQWRLNNITILNDPASF